MNETVTPPPTVSSLIGCRSCLSPGSLAAIGPSVLSPSLAWIYSEVGEGLDAGMLANIWHVPPAPCPSPPPWLPLHLQTAACGGFNSGTGGLHQDAPLCAGASEDVRLEHEGFLSLTVDWDSCVSPVEVCVFPSFGSL